MTDAQKKPYEDRNQKLKAEYLVKKAEYDAKNGGQALFGADIDLSKCFDREIWESCLRAAQYLGLHSTVVDYMRGFYERVSLDEVQGYACTGELRANKWVATGLSP